MSEWRRVKQHGRRDTNEPEIIAEFRRLECSVYQLGTPCDLLVGYDLRDHLVEVKQGNAPLTTAEEEFCRTSKGGPMEIVRNIPQARKLVRLWKIEGIAELANALRKEPRGSGQFNYGSRLRPSVRRPPF